MKRLHLLACGALALQAAAQTMPSTDDVPARIAAERAQLQAQRDAIELEHEALRRECWQRFAVNDCLRVLRRQRHAALDPLRAQELVLNAQEREWRTAQREERLREKADAQERQP